MTRPRASTRIVAIAVALAVAALSAAPALSRRELPSGSLWRLVQLCSANAELTSLAFPCLSVHRGAGGEPGYAIVPVPGEADILVVPTRRIAGIEDPALVSNDMPNWWSAAWNARGALAAKLGWTPHRTDIALAINSALSRSQDQLHIHVSCLNPVVRRALNRQAGRVTSHWSEFPAPLLGRRYLAMKLPGGDLTDDPFRLLADYAATAGLRLADQVLAVVPTVFSGSDGFLLLTTSPHEPNGADVAGEDLLDTRCRHHGG